MRGLVACTKYRLDYSVPQVHTVVTGWKDGWEIDQIQAGGGKVECGYVGGEWLTWGWCSYQAHDPKPAPPEFILASLHVHGVVLTILPGKQVLLVRFLFHYMIFVCVATTTRFYSLGYF